MCSPAHLLFSHEDRLRPPPLVGPGGGWLSFSFRNVLTGSLSCSTRGWAPPCSARRTGVRLGGQVRPALTIPADGADAEPEVSGSGGVVVVVREVVAVHRQVQDPRRA